MYRDHLLHSLIGNENINETFVLILRHILSSVVGGGATMGAAVVPDGILSVGAVTTGARLLSGVGAATTGARLLYYFRDCWRQVLFRGFIRPIMVLLCKQTDHHE